MPNQQSDLTPFLSILVPCYRDEEGVDELHRRLTNVARSMMINYEIVFIDDFSPDRTWEKIKELAKNDPNVKGFKLSRNHGHQHALTAGLKLVRGERVLIIDSDLQDPPELLPEMMRLMDEGADNVYGQRLTRAGVPVWKRMCYKLYYRILNLLAGCEIPPDTGDFRLISRKLVNLLNDMPEYHRFLRGMVSWLGFRQIPIHYHREARFAGETGYTLSKLFRIAIDGITSFSIRPLRFASMLGLVFGFLCAIGVIYSIVGHLRGHTVVAGWTSLMSVILLVASLQFFVLGIFGEYLGRLFIEQKRRPLFIIAESTEKVCDFTCNNEKKN